MSYECDNDLANAEVSAHAERMVLAHIRQIPFGLLLADNLLAGKEEEYLGRIHDEANHILGALRGSRKWTTEREHGKRMSDTPHLDPKYWGPAPTRHQVVTARLWQFWLKLRRITRPLTKKSSQNGQNSQ